MARTFWDLTERQRNEFKHFFEGGGGKLSRLEAGDLSPVEAARLIREEYDLAVGKLKEGPEAFLAHFREEVDRGGSYTLRLRIIYHVNEKARRPLDLPGSRGNYLPTPTLHVFHLLEDVRGPGQPREEDLAERVCQRADELVNQPGAEERYAPRRRGSRYPEALVQELAEEFGRGRSTIREMLKICKPSGWELPFHIRYSQK